MNKPYLWFFLILIIIGVTVAFFDMFLRFSYINSHNSTTYNDSQYSAIPQLIPSLPNSLVQPIILMVGATIIIAIFIAIWRYFVND